MTPVPQEPGWLLTANVTVPELIPQVVGRVISSQDWILQRTAKQNLDVLEVVLGEMSETIGEQIVDVLVPRVVQSICSTAVFAHGKDVSVWSCLEHCIPDEPNEIVKCFSMDDVDSEKMMAELLVNYNWSKPMGDGQVVLARNSTRS